MNTAGNNARGKHFWLNGDFTTSCASCVAAPANVSAKTTNEQQSRLRVRVFLGQEMRAPIAALFVHPVAKIFSFFPNHRSYSCNLRVTKIAC